MWTDGQDSVTPAPTASCKPAELSNFDFSEADRSMAHTGPSTEKREMIDEIFILHYRLELIPSESEYRTIVSVENVTRGEKRRFSSLSYAFDHIQTTLSAPTN